MARRINSISQIKIYLKMNDIYIELTLFNINLGVCLHVPVLLVPCKEHFNVLDHLLDHGDCHRKIPGCLQVS